MTTQRARPGPLLVVAATDLELEPLRPFMTGGRAVPGTWADAVAGELSGVPVVTCALGIGKANTAAGLALALAEHRPAAVVQVGVGGAYLGSFLSVGMVALASEDVHLDLGVRSGSRWEGLEALGFELTPARDGRPARANAVPTHPGLTAALAAVMDAPTVRFATLETVTGDVDEGAALARGHDVAVESMEGAAAAQVCDRLGVPFAEVRGVSNIVGERDRTRWNLRSAATVSCAALRALCRSRPPVLQGGGQGSERPPAGGARG